MKSLILLFPLFLVSFSLEESGRDHSKGREGYFTLFTMEDGPVMDYILIVKKLKKGDVVRFSNAKEFTLQKIGNVESGLLQTITTDNQLLYFPAHFSKLFFFDKSEKKSAVSEILTFNKSISSYHALGVPTVKYIDGYSGEYFLLENEPFECTYEEYLFMDKNRRTEEMNLALEKFLLATHHFEYLPALSPKTLVYSIERGWFLTRAQEGFILAKYPSKQTIFDSYSESKGGMPTIIRQLPVEKDLEAKIRDHIIQKRKE